MKGGMCLVTLETSSCPSTSLLFVGSSRIFFLRCMRCVNAAYLNTAAVQRQLCESIVVGAPAATVSQTMAKKDLSVNVKVPDAVNLVAGGYAYC